MADCPWCRDFLVMTLPKLGLTQWTIAPAPWTHVFVSSRAMEKLQALTTRGPTAENLLILQQEIQATGDHHQVAWIDLDHAGSWQVWRADHGIIPPEVRR